jgi:putative oxidoreductase
MKRYLSTNAPASVFLIRLTIAVVFVSEGVQKFLFADALGTGRFAKIGIPAPEVMAPFVGVVEIVCGSLVLIGFLTRLGSLLLLIDISVALISTKLPILLGHAFWTFHLPKLERYGFWSMLHEARTDLSMWLSLIFILIVGAGRWSVDALLAISRQH